MANQIGKKLVLGALAGTVGTLALNAMLGAHKKLSPRTLPPMRDDPGHFMVKQAENLLPDGTEMPQWLEKFIAGGLHFDYGSIAAMIYAAMPKSKYVLADGVCLGLSTWAAGYLGWLPATGLMPPVTRQKPAQVALPIAEHILFGLATAGLYRWIEDKAP